MKTNSSESIQWQKYDTDTLKLMKELTEVAVKETFDNYRNIVNKSYTLILFITTGVSYSFSKIYELGFCTNSYPHILTIIGLGIAVFLLYKNLIPGKMGYLGITKDYLNDKDFENSVNGEDGLKRLYAYLIDINDSSFTFNNNENIIRSERFKCTVVTVIVTLVLTILSYIAILLCQSLHA